MVCVAFQGLRVTLPFFGLLLPRSFNVNLTNRTVSRTSIDPQDAIAGFQLDTDGTIDSKSGDIAAGPAYTTIVGVEWLSSNGTNEANVEADRYECFATITSGTLTTGTTGSWLALSSARSWEKEQTVIGSSTVVFTLDIRLIGTTTVLATASITLTAEVIT